MGNDLVDNYDVLMIGFCDMGYGQGLSKGRNVTSSKKIVSKYKRKTSKSFSISTYLKRKLWIL